jgi:FkbM family methyltransferase
MRDRVGPDGVDRLLTKLKHALAPAVLGVASSVLRSRGLPSRLRDRVWKMAQKYVTFLGVTKEARIVNGMRMQVSSAPRVEQEIFLFGEWEPRFSRYLQGLPATDGILLDIGANIGYFSLLASPIFAEVHAIEASPSTSRRLKDNIALNGIRNVHVHTMAVGREEGFIDFFQDNGQSGRASTISSQNSVLEARVPVAPLETILDGLDWNRVRFVKIDIEGGEGPVLDSLFRLRDRLHPDVEIFVEYDTRRPDTWPAIEAFRDNGFSVAMLQGPYDRGDYLDQDRRSTLREVDGPPEIFCDLLLRRVRAA